MSKNKKKKREKSVSQSTLETSMRNIYNKAKQEVVRSDGYGELFRRIDMNPQTIPLYAKSIMDTKDKAISIIHKHIGEDYEDAYIGCKASEIWADANLSPTFSCDVEDEFYHFTLAAALWILDEVSAAGKIKELLEILPRKHEIPDNLVPFEYIDTAYSNEIIEGMLYVILSRNYDCVGDFWSRSPQEHPFLDGITLQGKQKQNVPSRQKFESIIAMIPQEQIDVAVKEYESKFWESVDIFAQFEKDVYDKKSKLSRKLKAITDEATQYLNVEVKKRQNAANSITLKVMAEPGCVEPLTSVSDSNMPTKPLLPIPDSMIARDNLVSRLSAENDEIERQLHEIESDERDYIFCSTVHVGYRESRIQKDLPSASPETAKRIRKLHVKDPYAISFAYLYLMDKGEAWANAPLPMDSVMSRVAYVLPWCGGLSHAIHASCLDADVDTYRVRELIGRKKVGRPKNYGAVNWHSSNIIDPIVYDKYDGISTTKARALFESTGVLAPRNDTSSGAIAIFNRFYVSNDKEKEILSAYVRAFSCAEKRISIDDKDDKIADLLSQVDSLKDQLQQCKSEKEKSDAMVYKYERASRDGQEKREMAEALHKQDIKELAELRSVLFRLNQEQETDKPDEPSNIEFPYTVAHNTVVFGGHDTWLNKIRPMLPNVRFYINIPSDDLIRNADVIWIQPNAIAHRKFYKIIDIVRANDIPIKYCAYALSYKCAVDVVEFDKQMSENSEK